MLYVLNVILPAKKNFKNSITALYGIGRIRAEKLASILGLHPSAKIEQVNQRQLNNLGRLIERSFIIDFELKRKVSLNISSLKKIRAFRGHCHGLGLPSRGQRTHTNASTAKMLSKKLASLLHTERSYSYNKSRFSFNNSKSKNKNKNKGNENKNKNKNKNKKIR